MLAINHTCILQCVKLEIHIYPLSSSPVLAVADPSNKLNISSLTVKSIAIQAIVTAVQLM